MKTYRKSALAFLVCTTLSSSSLMANEYSKESLADYDHRKFGMFIHWGIYSVAGGEYQGKKIRGIS